MHPRSVGRTFHLWARLYNLGLYPAFLLEDTLGVTLCTAILFVPRRSTG